MKKQQKDYILQLSGKAIAGYEKFNESIKIKKMSKEDGVVDSTYWPISWKTIYYKSYGRFAEIKLPETKLGEIKLEEVLNSRESVRDFSKNPISLNKLAGLLYYSCGIKKNKSGVNRFYPSPGGRYPLEVYILSLNLPIPKGFYHYYVKNNSLEKMFEFNKKDLDKITSIPWVKNAGCLIFISSVFKRNTIKYMNRGYRMMLQESGHMAHNFYLNAAALNLGICAIGGFVDDGVNKLLDLDGIEESVIYTLVVGEKDSKK